MHKAFTSLVIKSIDEDQRVIEGVATTPRPDRIGDIVEPRGAQFGKTVPLLMSHMSWMPAIGEVTPTKVTDEGIQFRARFFKDDVPGKSKDELDYAWRVVKTGRMSNVSIGFLPIEEERIKDTYSYRYTKWEWLELSVVTIPANPDASITTVKTLRHPDVSGAVRLLPAVAGPATTTNKDPTIMFPIGERIRDLEATRTQKALRLDEITAKTAQENRTKDAAEQKEFADLLKEVEAVDLELKDARALESIHQANAKPVNPQQTEAQKTVTISRATAQPQIVVAANRPKGHGFACVMQAMMAAKGTGMNPADLARRVWPDWPDVAKEIENIQFKAAVAPGTTTAAGWAAELAPIMPLTDEFLEILRPQLLISRIPGLTGVPFNSKVPRQDSAGGASWVGQSKPKPVSAMVFSSVDFPPYMMSKIVVFTKQLAMLSNPAAVPIIQREAIAQLIEFMDTQFILSSVALSATNNPASITNGVVGTASSGTAEANIRQDLRTLLSAFAANKYPLSQVVLVTSEAIAVKIATAVTALGTESFPGFNFAGGPLLGIQTVASQAVTEAHIVALHAPSIFVGNENRLEVSVSEEATVQMDDAPTDPLTSTTILESLWQRNWIGIRVEQLAGWLKGRTTAVDRITGIAYV